MQFVPVYPTSHWPVATPPVYPTSHWPVAVMFWFISGCYLSHWLKLIMPLRNKGCPDGENVVQANPAGQRTKRLAPVGDMASAASRANLPVKIRLGTWRSWQSTMLGMMVSSRVWVRIRPFPHSTKRAFSLCRSAVWIKLCPLNSEL